MLKFYRPHAEQMLLAATYLRSRTTSIEDVLSLARNYPCQTGEHTQVLTNARRNLKLPANGGHWLDPLIKQLFQSLTDESYNRGESDLIDQIVRILQFPYGRNILTGDHLRHLRSALLLPSEQAGLLARLRQREMSCSQCGTALHNLESVTLHVDGNNTQSIVCHRCAAPNSVPCASCAEVAALSTKAMNAMSRMQCPHCQEAKAPKKAPPSPADELVDITPAPADPYTYRTITGRGARGIATPIATRPATAWVTNTTAPGDGG